MCTREVLPTPDCGGTIERMFLQGSLLAMGEIAVDPAVPIRRVALDDTSWVDEAPNWIAGADGLFHELIEWSTWTQRRGVAMYDRLVDEPRLTSWWCAESGVPEVLPILSEIRAALTERYDVAFDSIGCNLYRNGADSVAWHGDRHRSHVIDPIVAIVSVGEPRPFKLRPRGGGASRTWELGRGDLLVMGGACQHDWEHSVPKVRVAGPRMSITFRHGARFGAESGVS